MHKWRGRNLLLASTRTSVSDRFIYCRLVFVQDVTSSMQTDILSETTSTSPADRSVIIIIIIIIIRPLGTDRSPVSTHRGRNSRPSERIINPVLFRAEPKDRISLRRQLWAQLSFSAHFSHCSALQLHLVAQQLSLRRRVTTPDSVFNFCYYPRNLYYRGLKL